MDDSPKTKQSNGPLRRSLCWALPAWFLIAPLAASAQPAKGIPDPNVYLGEITSLLTRQWPTNRTVNIVCHGHSVPAGYFKTPLVDTFNAYPHLLHRGLKERFPFAVMNVIVTAIGGENSEQGAARFARDVLALRPDVVTIVMSQRNHPNRLGHELVAAELLRWFPPPEEHKTVSLDTAGKQTKP